MPRTGERAYAYAKACGIIGKSFIGSRLAALEPVSRLTELDRLVFPQSFRELPERELLIDLERRITGRSAKQIVSVVNSFARPPELLVRLLRSYEYGDLKSALAAIAAGESKAPSFTNLGRFGVVKFAAYPDIKAMTGGTEFDFLASGALNEDGAGMAFQTKLDKHYYIALWESLYRLKRRDRAGIEALLSEEISLRNAVWVLRLRTYYRMTGDEVREKLIDVKFPSRGDGARRSANRCSLTADAEAALELPLDTRAPWAAWKRASFLNPGGGELWTADPRYFQNAASRYLYRLARHYFRRRPFSIDTAACFIKLKQFEEDLLTSIAEGLGIGMTGRDVFAMLEARP
ncbi:MAG: V-type ATPase subunit [Treponema sp.]|jgi:vacuolar-type H+-ATPase subunit C/Vma6|nr:V-type ATPase subunit [Treponema sp.]